MTVQVELKSPSQQAQRLLKRAFHNDYVFKFYFWLFTCRKFKVLRVRIKNSKIPT